MIFETAPVTNATISITLYLSFMLTVFAIIPLIIYRFYPYKGLVVLGVVQSILVGGFIIGSFLSIPHRYVIESDKIIVDRYILDAVIEFDNIKEVREADYSHWKGKNGWNAGTFGFAGRFKFEDYGRCNVYLTNWKYLVMIERKEGRPILISPENPRAFVSTYRKTSSTE